MPADPAEKRSYLPQDRRRQQILEAARALFGERPFPQVTVGDVARAAGVSRPTIHAYFGTLEKLFLASLVESGIAQVEARTATAPTPLRKRLAINIPAGLDVIEEHAEVWFAIVGHRHTSGSETIDAVRQANEQRNVQRSLEVNPDLISDTPATRAALHATFAMTTEAVRQYFDGALTRDQLETFVIEMWHTALKTAIAAMEDVGAPAGAATARA